MTDSGLRPATLEDRNQTSIYLVCFHSVAKIENGSGKTGQYLAVETAIRDGEWPYDNGDDPSFYVAHRGGPLTWGVCRQDVRNPIVTDGIVVFFSFTPVSTDSILYRLCSVATVTDKVDHRAIHRSERFAECRQLYINTLIHPQNDGWRYDESDRPSSDRHKDWLWRIADHRDTTQEDFDEKYAKIYENESFSENDIASGAAPAFGNNYVVFENAVILADPHKVAIAVKGKHENWIDETLQTLTVGTAASHLRNRRDYLRTANRLGLNVHRQIRFEMPADAARSWRETLIEALTRK